MTNFIVPDKHAKALDVMSSAENYNNWIYQKITPYVGDTILEIGCGIGNFTKFLIKKKELTCVDMIEECISKSRRKFSNSDNINYICGDFLDEKVLNSLPQNKYDTIICLNVLEHIEKDFDALKKMFYLLKKGGNLILIVPALQQIYGSLDEALGHVRRYDRNSLKQHLKSVGFKMTALEYFNSIGIFGWYINGRVLKKKNLSLLQTLLYDKIFIPVLSRIESFLSPSFGMSLLAVSKKE
ncbi:hypothetical protein A2230_04940 [candidate division WOR-1 bacterium RIFOXYA2_FULL_36_21]|uniref:Methyltransferase type 12 domain-containing protein n=1 Tax=candidate division WOR-1 bacterium RIFOXYB2_FULL_36_35 TaxID=1802578 RepID=A0A1F4S5P0_UNCSA|nr:MAG: hypothetical protein A2230_04940 [candidate division WOR-1 bacterium RIFOXYA2_FULL_36_21]OGC15751.1 MAG: hypothetical protein A2290_05365 [candidate division WOR-1 bacterium RIFOXYB2_FULL_36_35]OGC21106.1 MAG: hypothetical protein A2282_03695 [candidate division WOR-1 bacterium RIFOXYA12_FULL_36_13]